MNPVSVLPGSARPVGPRAAHRSQGQEADPKWLLLAGATLGILYLPTSWSLWHSLWQDRTHAHGPIVLAVVIWLFARGLRAQVNQRAPGSLSPGSAGPGALMVGFGLVLYAIGRSQSLYAVEVFSALPVAAGLIWLCFGPTVLRALWFPLFFLLFLVPLPGSFVDAVTHPLKLGVSWASEWLLSAMGYPVARAGVVLTVGPYQMFVADACAGLTSLFMLEAFGLLYLNVVRHASAVRNAILAILIVPISFVSNVLRVLLLCLITYHLGDSAGQGFLHDFSGVVLFTAALVLTVFADSGARLLSRWMTRRRGPVYGTQVKSAADGDDDDTNAIGVWPAVGSWQGLAVHKRSLLISTGAAACALVLAVLLTPKPVASHSAGDLEKLIPQSFGEWTVVNRPGIAIDVLANEPGETTLHSPYDQVINRVYRHRDGTIVDLAVAYGKHQRQEVKIHQPELCFASQGFRVKSSKDAAFERPAGSVGPSITGKHLYSEGMMAKLAASYWIRIGSVYADSAWETRWEILREGIRGRAVDGVLVRTTAQVASSDEAGEAHQRMSGFLADLLKAAPAELRVALAR